jgi:septal ring factor EnvC (AmiA/AmiB activator)
MKSYAKLILLFVFFGLQVNAQTKKDLEKKKSLIQKEISVTNKLLDETKKNKKLSLNQLVTLNQKITMREELINTINSEITYTDVLISRTSTSILSLQKEIKKLKEEYARMIYYASKNQSSYDRLMFVFSSEDFNQAFRRMKYFQQYSDYRKKQAVLIQIKQSQLNSKLSDLSVKRGDQQNLLQNKEQEKKHLTVEKSEKEVVLAGLQSKEKQLKEELRKKQEDAGKLQAAIQRIIEEEIRKAREEAARAEKAKAKKEKEKRIAANTKGGTPSKEATAPVKENKVTANGYSLTPEAQKLSENFEANRARLPWPVAEGVITSSFGEHEHPILKGVKVKNNGIDIATKQGAQVRCIFEGEVSGVVSIPGAGKAVIVRHGDYLTVYSNLADSFVQKGDKIKTKQFIGSSLTDEENKTEVHFEIWKGSITQNPASWIYRNN